MTRVSTDKGAPRRIGIREFRRRLNACLNEVQKGEPFILTFRNKPLAEIRPLQSAVIQRSAGALRGRIAVEVDFDILPDEELNAMEAAIEPAGRQK